MMWGRIREIIRKEVFQTLREPRMRVVLFIPPVLQLIIFGYAVNLDVENSRLGWMDQDRSPESRQLQAAFEGSRHFRIVRFLEREGEVQSLLDRGEVHAVVRLLPDFSERLGRGQEAQVQILVDGTDSNTASLVSSYAGQIIRRSARQNVGESRLTVRSRVWFNTDLRSQDYFVPGVVVNIIALVTVMLTAMAIVREKELGTMEQLMVTPVQPLELMLGKTLPFAAVGILEVMLVTGAALLIFKIPFRGSPLLLLAGALLFLLTTLGAGLLVSTISGTQQQAMMGSFFFFLPAFMLSGFAFPIRNMPTPVQYLTYLDPMRYFIEIVRGIFLKGTGLDVLWPQMAALLFYGLAMLGLSALRFRKRLD